MRENKLLLIFLIYHFKIIIDLKIKVFQTYDIMYSE